MPDTVPTSWNELDTLLGEMRELTAARGRKVAKRDVEVAEVTNRHAGDIDDLTAQIEQRETEARAFVAAQKVVFDGDKGRFKDLLHGRVGFRKSPSKIVFVDGKSAEEVIEIMVEERKFTRFLRKKIELDKAAIVKDMTEETMAELGISVVQEDNVFVDLKKS